MQISPSRTPVARRAYRLKKRKQRLKDNKCLNCEILLKERLVDKGRSYLYCRNCLELYKAEVRRHRWRRYYQRNRAKLKEKMRKRYHRSKESTQVEYVNPQTTITG